MPTVLPSSATCEEQPTSGSQSRQRGAKRRHVMVIRGVAASVKAAIPAIGSTVTIGGVSCKVVSTDYQPDRNGASATLTINGSKAKGDSADEEVTWEVEMAQIEKSIVSHPKYAAYADAVQAWRDDPSTDTSGYASDALECIDKLKRGVESYIVFAPVIRKTTVTDDSVTVGAGLGKIVSTAPTPPEVTVSGSWDWLKTRDSVSVDGDNLVRRVEEWTGADEWDADIYSSSSSNS